MLKRLSYPFQLVFDIETVPCLETAKRVYPELQALADDLAGLKASDKERKINRKGISDDQVLLKWLYDKAGATADDPKPFLKFFLHKIVSISGITRTVKANRDLSEDARDHVELKWFTLPMGTYDESDFDAEIESNIISVFLRGLGERNPQIIGWSSSLFDMPCLLQRAMIHGLSFPKLQRPAKPWEGVDYFGNGSDYHIDLMELVSSRSPQSKASLDSYARALRIPGKIGPSGADVADMWFEGRHQDILDYNECDTASTYLIWLNTLFLSGHLTMEDYVHEQQLFRNLLDQRIESGANHLKAFTAEWNRLQGIETEPSEPDHTETDESISTESSN